MVMKDVTVQQCGSLFSNSFWTRIELYGRQMNKIQYCEKVEQILIHHAALTERRLISS